MAETARFYSGGGTLVSAARLYRSVSPGPDGQFIRTSAGPTTAALTLKFSVRNLPKGAKPTGAWVQVTAGKSVGTVWVNGRQGNGSRLADLSRCHNGATVTVKVQYQGQITSGDWPPDDDWLIIKKEYVCTISDARLSITYEITQEEAEKQSRETDDGPTVPLPVGPGKTLITPGKSTGRPMHYPAGTTNFSMNGTVLRPVEFTVEEEDNGDFSAALTLPMDSRGVWKRLAVRDYLRLPTPARKSLSLTHLIANGQSGKRETALLAYKAAGSDGNVDMWTAPSSADDKKNQERKVLRSVNNGAKLYLLGSETGKNNTLWYHMATTKGKSGWVLSTEVDDPAQETITAQDVIPDQSRDQIFRIEEIEEDDEQLCITVRAKHVFYDLLKTVITMEDEITALPAPQALQMLFSYADHAVPFRIYTDCQGSVTGDFKGKNIVSALLEPDDGMVAQLKAHLIRDNFDIYIIQDIAFDRGVRIQHGRNSRGAKAKRSDGGMYNRIIAKIGDKITVVDDPNRGENDEIMAIGRTYDKKDGSARTQALREFKAGLAAQDFSLSVNFVLLSDTAAFAQYNGLQDLFLGDVCDVTRPSGTYQAAVSAYVWNGLLKCYDDITVGVTASQELRGSVSSYQIGSVGAVKLIGQLSGAQIASDEITTRHLTAAAITAEKIDASAVTADKINANAVTAEKIAAGAVTTEKLAAGAVTADKIAAGAIEADKITAAAVQAILAQITTAQIDWASINSLSAVMANIANAQIGTADIDFSHIKDLVADTAIITQGSGEKLYIKRLAVDAAQMVDLTVGQLTVKASDGQYYSLDVDIETGTVTANPVTVTQAEIDAGQTESGQHIIESDLTVSDLNAATATATEALINKLTAGRIDVDTLFARQAVIDAISTMEIAGEGTLSFFVTKQKELDGYVRVVAEGDVVYLEVGKAGDPARFRTDNRTMEVTNIKTERLGITQKMTRDEDWIFVAGKSGFGIKYVGEEVV